MKFNIKIWLLSLLVMATTTSCSDFLDKQPLEDLTTDSYWQTESDAELWVLAMFDLMQTALDDNFFLWGEVRSDNCQQAGSGSSQTTYLYNGLYSTLDSADWGDLYKVISQANFGIKYIPTIPETESALATYMGQVYAARAMMYFYAIRVWGDVPLITVPYEGGADEQKYYSRTSVEEVEEQILSDIETAMDYFTSSYSDPTMLSMGSVWALAADVHMWRAGRMRGDGSYDDETIEDEYEAVITATDAITLLGYSYATTQAEWKDIFDNPTQSNEPIFFIDWDAASEGVNGLSQYLAREGTNPQYKVSQTLWDQLFDDRITETLSSDDFRVYYLSNKYKLEDVGNGIITKALYESATFNSNFYFSKYSIEDPYMDNGEGEALGGFTSPSTTTTMPMLPMYRYSGVMLQRAEALNWLDRQSEAIAIVDYIRGRAGNADYTDMTVGMDTAELELIILSERQIELFGEGSRWFDLVRTNNVATVMDYVLISNGVSALYSDIPGRILFPIHSSAFEANNLLTQNEPYSK